jgi:hypothetical protein
MRRAPAAWRIVERRAPDGAIDSEQRARPAGWPPVEHSEAGAAWLGARYWRDVTRASAGLVRCRTRNGTVQLHVLGLGPTLLALGPVELAVHPDGVAWRAPIRGGALARRPGGTFAIEQHGPELVVVLEGYEPRLGRLYGLLQRPFHVAASRRFLRSVRS